MPRSKLSATASCLKHDLDKSSLCMFILGLELQLKAGNGPTCTSKCGKLFPVYGILIILLKSLAIPKMQGEKALVIYLDHLSEGCMAMLYGMEESILQQSQNKFGKKGIAY